VVLQSAIHVFARRRQKDADLSPRCPPLSMHPVFASNLLLHPIPALPFLAFFLSYSIHTSAPDHRFRKRSTPFLDYLLPLRPTLALLPPPTPPPPPTTPPPPPPTPLHKVPSQHRLAPPPSTTIHAALAAKITPLQAFCISPHPPPTTPSIYPAIPVFKTPTSRPRATRTSPQSRAASYTTTLH
jgi:hypothetical protein